MAYFITKIYNKNMKKILFGGVVLLSFLIIGQVDAFTASNSTTTCFVRGADLMSTNDIYPSDSSKNKMVLKVEADSSCVGERVTIDLCDLSGGGCEKVKDAIVVDQKVSGSNLVYFYYTHDFSGANPTADMEILFQVKGPENEIASQTFIVKASSSNNTEGNNAPSRLMPKGSWDIEYRVGVVIRPLNLSTELIGSGTPPFVWEKAGGAWPDGLEMDSSGYLRGTPTKIGQYEVPLKVTEKGGDNIIKGLRFTISATGGASNNNSTNGGSNNGDGSYQGGFDLSIRGLENLIQGLVCWVYRIAFLLIILFITWTGIKYLMYSGNSGKITEANKSFQNVVIGAIIILGVGVIVSTIANLLGVPLPFPGIC